MKITKYEHACLVVEVAGKRLVIDPGILANLPTLESVVAIVLTHQHPDHLSTENIKKLMATNPSAKVFAPADCLEELSAYCNPAESSTSGAVQIGPFSLEFFGGDHETIYKTVPCKNVGILVNDTLYYPGDSYTLPNKPVVALALPAAAPWLRVSDAIDFAVAVRASKVFPTHNGTLSEFGESVNYRYTEQAVNDNGGAFLHLEVGDSIEI